MYTESPKSIQHMIRMCNTNIDGSKQLVIALTQIKGIGFRFASSLLRLLNIPNLRAGELSEEQIQKIVDAINNPKSIGMPIYFFNHRKDFQTGEDLHLIGNQIITNERFALERGKKIKAIRELRRERGLKVRGQRTKSNGRGGKTVGVSRKK